LVHKTQNGTQQFLEITVPNLSKAFYCNPPRAKKSKYVHRIQKLLRDTVHHESVGKCAPPNAGTGATDSGYRKKRSIFDELEKEFNQEIEAEAQPEVQSEDDGFAEKGNYSPGGAKPSTATPNPKRKLDSDNQTISNPKVNSNSVRNNLIIIQKLINTKCFAKSFSMQY